MTGLDPGRHVILEIASLVTDHGLQVVAEGPELAVFQPDEALASMEAWSREHHARSGLLERVRCSKITCTEAEERTLRFVSRFCSPGEAPLCGNSVWQDRRFLTRYMPRLEAFFHYRNIDVSTLKELARRWYPDLPPFAKKKAHRALSDLRESVAELGYYRDHLFAPRPGS